MRVTKREVAFEGNYLRLVKKHSVTNDGKEYIWETVERTNIHGGGAVVVIAVTKNQEVILERNWRAPLESYIIQFPAGLTDIKEESEEQAARRELLEETGYMAGDLKPIITALLSPELTATAANHFFAPEVEYSGNVRQDGVEEIEVLKVPIAELDHFLLHLPGNTELDLRVPGILWILEKKGFISTGNK
jgi:ADP-ribose pyrophosphatase